MRVVIYEQSNAIQMKKKGKPIELIEYGKNALS